MNEICYFCKNLEQNTENVRCSKSIYIYNNGYCGYYCPSCIYDKDLSDKFEPIDAITQVKRIVDTNRYREETIDDLRQENCKLKEKIEKLIEKL